MPARALDGAAVLHHQHVKGVRDNTATHGAEVDILALSFLTLVLSVKILLGEVIGSQTEERSLFHVQLPASGAERAPGLQFSAAVTHVLVGFSGISCFEPPMFLYITTYQYFC